MYKLNIRPTEGLQGTHLKYFYRILVGSVPPNWRERPSISLTVQELKDAVERVKLQQKSKYLFIFTNPRDV